MPPPWIRRPVTITFWLIVSTAVLALSPVLLGLADMASSLTGQRRMSVAARLFVTYFVQELGTLAGCGALWVASGAGWRIRSRPFEALHWRLLRWYVRGLAKRALTLLDIKVVLESSDEAASALDSERPLVMFSRHAGPGDTVFLVDRLLTSFRRRPTVVFKQSIALDPSVDLLGHRLPHAVLDIRDREGAEERIAQLAAGLRERGVLLLFPEGGNFTPERRRSALAHLWRKGERRAAAYARSMSHVLPPRPSGAQAALRGNRSADVIFAAHTGLGLAAYPREIWRDMPFGRTMYTRMWFVPAAEVPDELDEQVTWLNGWWKRIDDWIEQHQSAGS